MWPQVIPGICLIYCIGELCLAGQLSNILFTLCFASLVYSPQFKDSYKEGKGTLYAYN